MNNPTLDRLRTLGLTAMADEWIRQQQDPGLAPLSFDERLALLVDAEGVAQDNRRFTRRLREAHLRLPATPEGLDYTVPRQWNTTVVRQFTQALWVAQHQTVLITGPTGVGKSYLACALGHAACRRNWRVRYYRVPRLLADGLVARQEAQWFRWLAQLARYDLLILDEWAGHPLSLDESRDLLEILDDRYGVKATLIASQVPRDRWAEWFPDATVAEAILDRVVHQAYHIAMQGESMRKILPSRPSSGITDSMTTS
jgi:DNA replication protein DnaC